MSANALVTQETVSIERNGFNRDQIDLIKRTVAKDTTDDELALFLYTAKKRGLDPLIKQIYAIKRKNKSGPPTMTIQTSVDGLRAIADRTNKYSPGRKSEFDIDAKKKTDLNPSAIVSCTAYVMKLVGKTWHEVGATAYWDEYFVTQMDYNTQRLSLGQFWKKMPFTMIEKCAESKALRKAFPEDLGGLYTFEEMQQADTLPPADKTEKQAIQEFEEASPYAKNIERAEAPVIETIDDHKPKRTAEISRVSEMGGKTWVIFKDCTVLVDTPKLLQQLIDEKANTGTMVTFEYEHIRDEDGEYIRMTGITDVAKEPYQKQLRATLETVVTKKKA